LGSDPALYDASGYRIADDEAGNSHWRYTIPAGATMTIYAGTYSNGIASYTVTATFPTETYINAATPNITSQPTDITVIADGMALLTSAAIISDSGTLTDQWYSNTINSDSDWTPISGATETSYSAPTTTAGTRYYYCIVTNTNNNVTGNKTATAKSNIAAVTVTPVPVTGVSLNKTTTQLNVGDTETLTASVIPTNATNKTVTWTSSNTSVATVAGGLVTAAAAGTATITATTQDGGFTATCAVTVTSTPTPTVPTITTTTLPGGTVGTAYSQTLTATGTAPIAWSIDSGSLPSGLSLNASTGAISGTPTAASTSNFTVKASNSAGSATKTLSITIVSPAVTLMKALVINGTGGGDYEAGAVVTVTAGIFPDLVFTEWDISPAVTFANGTDKFSPTAQFVMPSQPVRAIACYDIFLGITVTSPTHSEAAINLTTETYTLPSGFHTAGYSLDGGKTWKKGPLPTGTKFSNLLNKRTQIWLTDQLNSKKKPVGDNIIKFPIIEKRPKANAESLGLYYLADTWTLRTKKKSDVPYLQYEYAPTDSKNKPLDEWEAFDFDDGMEIQDYKMPKTSYLFRTPAMTNGSSYTPASKAFKVTPATYIKTPSYKLKYGQNGTATLSLKKGACYTFAGKEYPPMPRASKVTFSDYAIGTEIEVWVAGTGKKPCSKPQVLTLSQ
jgi:hypothetical protein